MLDQADNKISDPSLINFTELREHRAQEPFHSSQIDCRAQLAVVLAAGLDIRG